MTVFLHLFVRSVIQKVTIVTLNTIFNVVVGVTHRELNFHLFKAIVLSTFTYGIKIWGGNLNYSHWKVFEKGMKIHMMYIIKVCLRKPTIFCWPNLENSD